MVGTDWEEKDKMEMMMDQRIDGRTLRRRNRTENLSTKVRLATIQTIQKIAAAERVAMVDVIERAIDAYDRQRCIAK